MMSRNDAAANIMFKHLSPKQEQTYRKWAREHYHAGEPVNEVWHPVVRDECAKINTESQGPTLTVLYNEVERPLSQALQPECSRSAIMQMVTEARNSLRKIMRNQGWQGPF